MVTLKATPGRAPNINSFVCYRGPVTGPRQAGKTQKDFPKSHGQFCPKTMYKTDREEEKQTDKETKRHTHRQVGRQMGRKADKQTLLTV